MKVERVRLAAKGWALVDGTALVLMMEVSGANEVASSRAGSKLQIAAGAQPSWPA